uniref:NADP-dependent oxidoreductase domain-containing protein n=1 Tax=Tetraselmis chuii TaxID=63592 RepID=A0A7S1X8X4_9CHLO|mmetsp:Transcript_5582/g.10032  ORF Transcript_5582/g.10032 Transcript_5582/m.10032 type:complete len:324 (+) Transcript_5582:172-1143(+)|eukprot:CAMPEP_0177762896 /NCGR_PEP_ID=MMETSP0491_2-20121128/6584_1 /TAXON_ID=63592 /ORGANISM="Tetraselmis chuii, Strain PLY429" /LENGTH=323 /DNA_ID=CAMNT_0019278971 /DNA_START=151 /DNA_END=1122 /DNA_ORIENTATION=+
MVQQGFGCMGITAFYGGTLEQADGVALLQGVLAEGVTHFDTAEMYRSSFKADDPDVKYNEHVVGAFAEAVGRDKVFIATKLFPGLHGDTGMTTDGALASLDASLERLGTDYVDLWYLHRLPSNHDVKVFMTAAKAAVEAGKVKAVGLSEASAPKIREAHAIHPVAYIQQEWSLLTRNAEELLLPTCKELGITLVAYSPLARNLLANVPTEPPNDWRAKLPRYSPGALAKNAELLGKVREMADSKGCSAAQLSLAWLLEKSRTMGVTCIPIPGTTKLAHARDNIAAEKIRLTTEEMSRLEEIGATVEGDRGGEDYKKMGIEAQL